MHSPLQNPTMGNLGTAFLTWRRYLQQQLDEHGITLKQLFVLRKLSRVTMLNPSQIAEDLYCDRPTATVILNNMCRYGWIEKKPSAENRKFVHLFITDAGQAKLESIDQSAVGQSGGLLDPVACFSAEELQQLNRLLAKLNQHLEQVKKTGPNERNDKND